MQASSLYIASGETCDWVYAETGALCYTVELEGRSFYPGAGVIESVSANNVKAALYFLKETAANSRK